MLLSMYLWVLVFHSARHLMNGGIANTPYTKKSIQRCLSVLAVRPVTIPFICMEIRNFTAIAKFPDNIHTYIQIYTYSRD